MPIALSPFRSIAFHSGNFRRDEKQNKTHRYISSLEIKMKCLFLLMRLSEFEIESITKLAHLHFGVGVHVVLFGSRTDNQQRGGDIDLFICNSNVSHLKTRTKINFLTDLMLQIGEQKIDVVLDNSGAKKSVFFKTIFETGIQLC